MYQVHCLNNIAKVGTDELGDMQQFTVAVFAALLAVYIMVGQKQFNASSSSLNRLRVGDPDLHTFADRENTACDKSAGTTAGSGDEADAAGTLVAFSMVKGAQRGDLITAFLRSFKNRKTGFHLIGLAFDLNIN